MDGSKGNADVQLRACLDMARAALRALIARRQTWHGAATLQALEDAVRAIDEEEEALERFVALKGLR